MLEEWIDSFSKALISSHLLPAYFFFFFVQSFHYTILYYYLRSIISDSFGDFKHIKKIYIWKREFFFEVLLASNGAFTIIINAKWKILNWEWCN